MSSQEDDDDPSTLSASHPQQHHQFYQQHQPGGILSPLSLESAEYYEELRGADSSSVTGSSRGPTPLAHRAPWATPPKAAFEKLSVTSPPLPPFPQHPIAAAPHPPPARNAVATVDAAAAGSSLCVRVGDALLRHQLLQQQQGSSW